MKKITIDFSTAEIAEIVLYQYDYGIQLEISGITLDETVKEMQFQNGTGTPASTPLISDGNTYLCTIPDECLQQSVNLFKGWLWMNNDTSGATLKQVIIYMKSREKPESVPLISSVTEIKGYAEYVKENADKVCAAETAAEKANAVAEALLDAKENGDFNGKKGDTGSQGPPGKDGTDDYTQLKNLPRDVLSTGESQAFPAFADGIHDVVEPFQYGEFTMPQGSMIITTTLNGYYKQQILIGAIARGQRDIIIYRSGEAQEDTGFFYLSDMPAVVKALEAFLEQIPDFVTKSEVQQVISGLNIPVKTSELTNDSQFVNEADLTAAISSLGSVFTLKGSKVTTLDLPDTGNKVGDVWYVQSKSAGYVWISDNDIERWEMLGETVDLSAYYTKIEVDTLLNGKHTYSTDEQVVGTWIDGSPLYEKTIQVSFNENISDFEVDVSDLNIKDILFQNFAMKTNDGLFYTINSFSNNDNVNLVYIVDEKQLYIAVNSDTYRFPVTFIIVFRYTKTTD